MTTATVAEPEAKAAVFHCVDANAKINFFGPDFIPPAKFQNHHFRTTNPAQIAALEGIKGVRRLKHDPIEEARKRVSMQAENEELKKRVAELEAAQKRGGRKRTRGAPRVTTPKDEAPTPATAEVQAGSEEEGA